jgi:hypothetical protein
MALPFLRASAFRPHFDQTPDRGQVLDLRIEVEPEDDVTAREFAVRSLR